jgi:nucleoside-diphosphate-sugar epimerase
MSLLIGHTGYVGGHLVDQFQFNHVANSKNIDSFVGFSTDLLVCAGLPAFKAFANANPREDLDNMERLWRVVSTIRSDRAVLVSSIDVYSTPQNVNENTQSDADTNEPYGRHRAEFERRFSDHFELHQVIRLPGLFSKNLRKNLVFDLMHKRADQLLQINAKSTFQYFNTEKLWSVIETVIESNISLLNVSSEPVSAGEIAAIFGVRLNETSNEKHYDMKTLHADVFGLSGDYLFSKDEILYEIKNLLENEELS